MAKKCAICRKGKTTKATLHDYGAILQSMGILFNKYAHARCVVNLQQQALQFRGRIPREK